MLHSICYPTPRGYCHVADDDDDDDTVDRKPINPVSI